MTLELKCDDCGAIGGTKEIFRSEIYERDLCPRCYQEAKLEDLREKHREKKEWLEITHLKDLKDMEQEIAKLELKKATSSV